MIDLNGLNAIIGAILPPFIQLVNQKVVNSMHRYVIAVLVSLGIGTVTTLISGDLDLGDILVSAGVVISTSQITYRTFWNNTDAAKKLMVGK